MRRPARTIACAAMAATVSGCSTVGSVYQDFANSLSADDGPPVYLQMSDADVNLANAALDSALESRISGAAVSWRNPQSGNSGSVTPLATFRAADGSYCRRYREEMVIAGREGRYVDVACRRARRLWIPIES